MKRLLKISFNQAYFSLSPIVAWFAISLITDSRLVNVFSITYPLQFIYLMLNNIFAVGANISCEKDKNKDAVLNGTLWGIVVGFIIFGLFVIYIEDYLIFMDADISIYREYCMFAIILLYIQLVFSMLLNKYYFEDREDESNRVCIVFNTLHLVVFILSALIFKENFIIITLTLSVLSFYVFRLVIKEYRVFRPYIGIFNYFRYNSSEVVSSLLFFLIYLFGVRNTFSYGEEYALAYSFITLCTDTQWDTLASISTVAKVDIVKNRFKYREQLINALTLSFMLITSSVVMMFVLWGSYNLDFKIVLVYFTFFFTHILSYPFHNLKTCYLQLEYSALKVTMHKTISYIIRLTCSFLITPYCSMIGELASALYQLAYSYLIFKKLYNYKI